RGSTRRWPRGSARQRSRTPEATLHHGLDGVPALVEEESEVVPGKPGVAFVAPAGAPAVAKEDALMLHVVGDDAELVTAGDVAVLVDDDGRTGTATRCRVDGVEHGLVPGDADGDRTLVEHPQRGVHAAGVDVALDLAFLLQRLHRPRPRGTGVVGW